MKNIKINTSKSIEELEEIIFLQQQIIEISKAEIISYKERYIRLLEEFKLEKHRLYASSSEKNILQSDLFDEAGIELSDDLKNELDDKMDVASFKRTKHPIRKPIPKDIPREVVIYDINDKEKICGCGAHLSRIGEEISEQIKYIPATLRVLQHVRPKYACKPCQENVKIAKMPTLLLPKSLATPELVAYTIIAKFCDHIPLYRQEAIWQRLGIDLARSSACGWLMKTAELCERLVRLNQKILVAENYIQADETTVQVLNEVGRDNTTKSYMWCYRGGGEKPIIIYEYQPTRGGYHAINFLEGFNGYLQSDAYSGYNFAIKNPAIIKLGCMAHARRKFADIVKLAKTRGLAHEAINFFKALYKIEKEARENNLSSIDRFKLRDQKAPSVLEKFKLWLDGYLTKTPLQSKIYDAIRYTLSNWDFLKNYLQDGKLEIDNNQIENSIRPFALGRKNWLFKGSPTGAKAGAIFYSLIETCKANNVEPYKYFCAMLNRIRQCTTEEHYHELLPQFIKL